MSQKVQIYQNRNAQSRSYGKYFVRPVYDEEFITTAQLADFIQTQCTVKRSDCKAVLDELGGAMKHYFELGQKIRIDDIGIFKVGCSSKACNDLAGCTAASVKNSRVLFAPQTEAVPTGKTKPVQRPVVINGTPTMVTYQMATFRHQVTMLKDVRFELAQDSQNANIASGGDGGNDNP